MCNLLEKKRKEKLRKQQKTLDIN